RLTRSSRLITLRRASKLLAVPTTPAAPAVSSAGPLMCWCLRVPSPRLTVGSRLLARRNAEALVFVRVSARSSSDATMSAAHRETPALVWHAIGAPSPAAGNGYGWLSRLLGRR